MSTSAGRIVSTSADGTVSALAPRTVSTSASQACSPRRAFCDAFTASVKGEWFSQSSSRMLSLVGYTLGALPIAFSQPIAERHLYLFVLILI